MSAGEDVFTGSITARLAMMLIQGRSQSAVIPRKASSPHLLNDTNLHV